MTAEGIGRDGVYYSPMPMDQCPECTTGPFGFEPCEDHWEESFDEDENRYGSDDS